MERKFIRTFTDLKNRSHNSQSGEGLTRRQLLLGIASLGLAGTDLFAADTDIPVIVITLPGSFEGNNPHYFYLRVWEEIIGKLSGKKKLLQGVNAVLGKEKKYNLKIDCRSACSLPDNWMISAFLEVLSSKGVQPWEISLWDKRKTETLRAGFNLKINSEEFAFKSAEEENYRDNRKIQGYSSRKVYSPLWYDKNARFPLVNFLEEQSGSIIFTTPKYHPLCGVDGALASAAMGAVARSGRLADSSDNMIRAICEIWKNFLHKNNVLNVVDATSTLFEGGPVGLPYYKFSARQLIVGRDPVAVDKVALDIIDKKRAEVKYTPALENGIKLLKKAESMGLGKLDTEVIRINILE